MENDNNKPEEKQTISEVNERMREEFLKTEYSERTFFVSHCIRHDLRDELVEYAKSLGYKVHVVGGGSIVLKKIEAEEPKAVVGIACYAELEMAIGKVHIPFQTILLDTDGCKETLVNVERAKEILKQKAD